MPNETKTEKFERVAAPRIRNVNNGLELLGNLARSDYEASDERKREIIEGFTNRLLALSLAWGVGPDPEHAVEVGEISQAEPVIRAAEAICLINQVADGGAEVGHEVAWAIDAIRRGEYDLATDRLSRCIQEARA